MAQGTRLEELRRMRHVIPLAMLAFAVPLFIWSAFNAGYFTASDESFVIPLAVFFGAPIALAAALWAFYRSEPYLGTAAGLFAAFWASFGMLLWLTQRGVVTGETGGDIRGFFFVPWAIAFGTIWVASIREHWTLALVSLGAGAMFAFLAIGHYAGEANVIKIGGWVGFVTSGVGWYAALAELVNIEFERTVLPTDADSFRELTQRAR